MTHYEDKGGTLADRARAYALAQVGNVYWWSGVPDDDEVVHDPDDTPDCSGLTYGLMRHIWRLAVQRGLVKGPLPYSRPTAAEFASMSVRITEPSIVGLDFGIKRTGGAGNGGHVHHIGPYIGNGQVVDARGTGLGVHLETVSWWNGHGITHPDEVEWRRLKPMYGLTVAALGKLTPPNLGPLLAVPDFRGLSGKFAVAQVKAAGFVPVLKNTYNPTIGRYLISSQSPAPGVKAHKGSEVIIVQSLGAK